MCRQLCVLFVLGKKRDKNASFFLFTGKFTGTAVYCEPTAEVQVPRVNDEKKKLPGAR